MIKTGEEIEGDWAIHVANFAVRADIRPFFDWDQFVEIGQILFFNERARFDMRSDMVEHEDIDESRIFFYFHETVKWSLDQKVYC